MALVKFLHICLLWHTIHIHSHVWEFFFDQKHCHQMNLPFLNSLKMFASLEPFIITHMINGSFGLYICLWKMFPFNSVYFLMPFSRCLNYVVSSHLCCIFLLNEFLFLCFMRKLFIIIHVIYLFIIYLLLFSVPLLSTKTYINNKRSEMCTFLWKLWMKFWSAIKNIFFLFLQESNKSMFIIYFFITLAL